MSDTSSDGGWSGIWSTGVLAAAQGLAVYALFECWRHQSSKKNYYQPRRLIREHRTPEAPGHGLFSWIGAGSKINDDELHRMVGMDHYVLLRFVKFGRNLTFMTSIVAAVLIGLVYLDGGNNREGFGELTMANVPNSSERLWYSVGFYYIVVFWALYLLWKEWENFVPKRSQFLAEGDPDMNKEVAYSAVVENIPVDKRSSPALYGYFDNLFPGKVSYASLCMDAGDLEKILSEKDDALAKIEHAVAQKHLDKPKEKKTKVGGVLCCGGEKVDTESYYRSELQKHINEAEKEHTRISQVASQGAGSAVASSTGFVAFTSVATKLTAVGVSLSGERFEMDTDNAPAPDDVIWENVTVPDKAITSKRMLANCLWTLGILTWAVPVTFVQAIADLDQLAATLDWLPWVPDPDSFWYGLIAGLLPVVALAVLTALVPIVIRLAAIKFIQMKSEGAVDLYVFKWHFGFRVANLFLIVIGGSILNRLEDFSDDPGSIVTLLGNSVPGKGEFFFLTLMVTLLSGLWMDLSRVVTVVIGFIMGAMSDEKGKSDREIRTAKAPPSVNWGTFYPPLLFVLMVVYVYAAITPIILPLAWLLFAASFMVYKNQALYVYVQTAESGGAAMYLLFSFGMSCLYVGEIVFIGYLGIKDGAGQGGWAVALVFITMAWHYLVNLKFVSVSKKQSLEAAVAADNKILKAQSELGPSSTADQHHPFDGKAYVQSCLKKSEWETKPEGYRDPANALKDKIVPPRMEHALERGTGMT